MYLMGTIWQSSNGKALFEKHSQQMGKWCKQFGTKPWKELNGKALNLFIERTFVTRQPMTALSSSGILIRGVIEEPLLEICRNFCHQPRDSPTMSRTDLRYTDQGITFKRPLVCHHWSFSGTTQNNICSNPIFICELCVPNHRLWRFVTSLFANYDEDDFVSNLTTNSYTGTSYRSLHFVTDDSFDDIWCSGVNLLNDRMTGGLRNKQLIKDHH